LKDDLVSDPNAESWSQGALLQLARSQRRILWVIVVGLLVMIPLGFLGATASPRDMEVVINISRLVGVGFGIVQLYAVWQLATALRSSVPWLYCVLAFVPCVWLFSLLFLNQNATRVLKANSIKVGFMGANLADFGTSVSFAPDECNACGKSLMTVGEVLECPKCRVNICDSCAVQTRVGGGMVESFSVTCPKCKAELVETRTKEAPAEEDFDEEEA